MKNRYRIFITTIIASLTLVSCQGVEDALLDLEASSVISDKTIVASEDNLNKAVDGVYANLAATNYYGEKFYWLTMANSSAVNANGKGLAFNQMSHVPSDGQLLTLWEQMYKTIGNANNIITLLNESNTTLPNKNESLGQLYFIRALAYFDLVRLFGEVPLRIERTNGDNLYLKKSSRTVIYNQIIKDFELAKTLLPTSAYTSGVIGRPKSYAANAFLTKVYVELASKKDATDLNFTAVEPSDISTSGQGLLSNFWQAAKAEVDVLVDDNGNGTGAYSLTTLENLFGSAYSEHTSESIFEISYSNYSVANGSSMAFITLPSSSNHSNALSGGNVVLAPWVFKEQVNLYGASSAVSTSGSATDASHVYEKIKDAAALDKRDPRIDRYYIYSSYFKRPSGVVTADEQTIYPRNTSNKNGGVSTAKFKEWYSLNDNSIIQNSLTSRNTIVMRFAEVLLMKAEIENELGDNAAATNCINKVLQRARAEVSTATQPADITAGMSQADLRDRILLEYLFELSGEGGEWFLERRRGFTKLKDFFIAKRDAAIVTDDAQWNVKYTPLIAQKHMLFPIPSVELSSNLALKSSDQNPGY